MNKKELTTIATEEQRLYVQMKYTKKRAKHFYNFAVNTASKVIHLRQSFFGNIAKRSA